MPGARRKLIVRLRSLGTSGRQPKDRLLDLHWGAVVVSAPGAQDVEIALVVRSAVNVDRAGLPPV